MEEYLENNMQVIQIEDYISIEDYFNLSSGVNLDDVTFNILWNSEKQCINKGFLFVFRYSEKLYNILIDDGSVHIDERTKVCSITEERFLRVDYLKDDYSYSLLKHDENGSTFYTMYYSKNPAFVFGLDFTPKEAYEEIQRVIETLKEVSGIENIISTDKINEVVLSDIKERIKPRLWGS